MTQLRCDDCGDNFHAQSLDDVTKHPETGEALCPECDATECRHCQRTLDIGDLTEAHVHDDDGFVCDLCPRVSLPYEFTMTYRREPEGYIPSYMDDIFPDVRLGSDYNADGIRRDYWRFVDHVTYRLTQDRELKPVALNGTYLDGEQP